MNNTDALRVADIATRLERLPASRFSYLLLLMLMPAWIAESYDIGIIGATIAVIKPIWHPSANQLGLLAISSTVSIVLGLLPSGILVDKFGRRPVLIGGICWFSIFTALGAVVPNIELLTLTRFLAGFGAGAVFPLPYVFLAEFMAPGLRAKFVGYLNGLLTTAYVVPPLVAVYLLAHYPHEIAWRLLYAIAIIPLLYSIILYVWLPESPRWLAVKGRANEALKIVIRMEESVKRSGRELAEVRINPVVESVAMVRSSWKSLFRPPQRKRTLLVWFVLLGTLPVFYVLLTFAPILMVSQGFKLANSLVFVAALQFMGGAGGLVQGILSDKWGRRPLIAWYGIATVAGLAGLALSSSVELQVTAGLLVGFFGLGIYPVTKLYVAEQFPTAIRGWGTGTTESFARLFGGTVFIYLVPYITPYGGAKLIIWIVCIILFLATILPVAVVGRETKGVNIDSMPME